MIQEIYANSPQIEDSRDEIEMSKFPRRLAISAIFIFSCCFTAYRESPVGERNRKGRKEVFYRSAAMFWGQGAAPALRRRGIAMPTSKSSTTTETMTDDRRADDNDLSRDCPWIWSQPPRPEVTRFYDLNIGRFLFLGLLPATAMRRSPVANRCKEIAAISILLANSVERKYIVVGQFIAFDLLIYWLKKCVDSSYFFEIINILDCVYRNFENSFENFR